MLQAHLADRTVVRVSGSEAEHFLQNLITCDVEGVAEDAWTFGALLTPQGKILFEFFLCKRGDAFLLDTAEVLATKLVARLTFYKLRADVAIEKTEKAVSVRWGDGAVGNDPRVQSHCERCLEQLETTGDYHAHRIASGLPELGRDFDAESVFPHEALMDQFAFGGVDFAKGCYVGQEVVSRMQHRGTARRRFVRISGTALPEEGTDITADGKVVGTTGSSADDNGLALVRLDRVSKAVKSGLPLLAGDAAISLELPSFAAFGWPE